MQLIGKLNEGRFFLLKAFSVSHENRVESDSKINAIISWTSILSLFLNICTWRGIPMTTCAGKKNISLVDVNSASESRTSSWKEPYQDPEMKHRKWSLRFYWCTDILFVVMMEDRNLLISQYAFLIKVMPRLLHKMEEWLNLHHGVIALL